MSSFRFWFVRFLMKRLTGGYVCLGQFLFKFLAGKSVGYPLVTDLFTPNGILTAPPEDLKVHSVPANFPRKSLLQTLSRDSTLPSQCTHQITVSFRVIHLPTILFILLSVGAFLNDTLQPVNYNYVDPSAPFSVNGISDPTSQRFHDTCEGDFVVDIPDTPAFKPE